MSVVDPVASSATPGGAAEMKGIGRNFSTLLAGELTNKALRFGAAAVLARGLSPREYGLFNVGIAVSGIIVVLATLGLPEVVGRTVAVDNAQAGRLSGLVLTARVLATAAVAGVGLVALELLWPGHTLFGLAIAAMALAMGATADWLARSLERMRHVAAGAATGGAVALAGSVVVTVASGSAAAGLAVFVVAELAADAVYWSVARRGVRLGTQGLGRVLRNSWPVALSSVAIYSYSANLDTIIMAATRSESEAGVYSAAYRLYLTVCIVAVFAAYAAFPRLSRSSDLVRIEVLVARLRPSLELLLCYGAVVVGATALGGEGALRLLFGERFGEAAATLTLLSLSAAWYSVGFPIGYNLVAALRNRRFLAGAMVGAAVNLVLDLILIPRYGLIAGGVATTASSICATAAWLGPRGLACRPARPVIAALAATTAAALVALAADGARVPVGAATLVAGALAAASIELRRRRSLAAGPGASR